jgi:hypothetical protein
MRLMMIVLFLALLVLIDVTWYRGHYLNRLADLIRWIFWTIGLSN